MNAVKTETIKNAKPIPLRVDFNQQEFTMSGGPIQGKLKANDEVYEIDLWLEIHTPFDNLAPIASFAEMPTCFLCLDINKAVVTLNASASFDPDGGNIVSYLWMEDYGLSSECLLGKAKTVSVPMNFGNHRVTLTVTDDKGVIDRKTVMVEVYDPKLDDYQSPADVFVLETGQLTKVDIGIGTASDGCSGVTQVFNNAPAGLLFPPGFTPVDWTFHDYNGNYETKAQGKQIKADEYILLQTPSGEIYSFDKSDRIVRGSRVDRHRFNQVFGVNDTKGLLVINRAHAVLSQGGLYTFTYVLTKPGGSHSFPQDFIAFDRLEFKHTSP